MRPTDWTQVAPERQREGEGVGEGGGKKDSSGFRSLSSHGGDIGKENEKFPARTGSTRCNTVQRTNIVQKKLVITYFYSEKEAYPETWLNSRAGCNAPAPKSAS